MQQKMQHLMQAFQHHLLRQGKSPLTAQAYLATVQEFLKWLEDTYGETDIARVDAIDVQEYQAWLRSRNQKPSTINRKLGGLRKFFLFANQQGWISSNPASKVEWEREVRLLPKALSTEQVRKILRAARKSGNLRDWALMEVLACTGLRVSELINLRRRNVLLKPRSIWIVIERGKRRKRYRIPITSPRAKEALRKYLATLPQDPDTKVFPVTRQTAWRIVKRYSQEEGVSPHSFRHTVITHLVRDRDLVTAQVWAGHANLRTTARYAQPSEETLEEASQALPW